MSKSAKRAPKTATVSVTFAGRTWTATAATKNEALVKLQRLIEEGSN